MEQTLDAIDFEKLFRLSPNPYMLLDRELRYVAANEAYLGVTGRRLGDLLGRFLFDVFPGDPGDPEGTSARRLRESFERVLGSGVNDSLALIRYAIQRPTSEGMVFEERFWSATHTPILDAQGRVAFILQHTVDVTELQKLQRELVAAQARAIPAELLEGGVFERARVVQECNEQLNAERRHTRRLFEQAPGFVCVLRGPEHVFEIANQAYYQVTGHRELIGKSVREALPELAGQGYFELLDKVHATREPFVGRESLVYMQRKPNGPLDEIYIDFVYQPIIEPDGTVSGIFTQGYEVTEQKRTRETLRLYQEQLEQLVQERTRALEESEAERRQAESALRHAQKMEAIGELTGGVSHDFNNLLHVISGNLQLLQLDLPGDHRAQERVQQAMGAVQRGAKLASQLLAFARRQALEPQVIHLGRLVRGASDLLRRSLGEGIAIETVIDGGLWNTLADPNQLENVILNLAINARDAMDGSGKLTIEAGNASLDEHAAAQGLDVAPGQYVMLAVSDTGSGMPPEIKERIFEPFFTTKPEGHGTGLGLSMVYGFIKQSDGHIFVDSAVGRGTTFKIYLPRSLQGEALDGEPGDVTVEGGTETILVVEDDASVRLTVVNLLEGLGYRVLTAADGASALALLQSGVEIDLLFTDVVMPGELRSPELARLARARLPELQVLFTSGYPENAIVHGGRLDPGVALLGKPYRREDLARKIRHQLGNRQPRQAPTEVAPVPVKPAAPRPLHILLVEDDPDVQDATATLLVELGHRVRAVFDAETATLALEQAAFDVLFTDVTLPGRSGVQLAGEAVSRWPRLHVILASGWGAELSQLGGTAMAGAQVLRKPYDFVTIKAALDRAEQR